MTSNFTINEKQPILVELTYKPGTKKVSLSTKPEELIEKSSKALDSAMNTIHHMARRVTSTINALAHKPAQIEVEFSLKLDAEAGALIAKGGVEAGLNVKLVWETNKPKDE